MIIYAKLQSSRVRHQYGIFGGESQTSFTRNATRAGSEEGRLFSQANLIAKILKHSNQCLSTFQNTSKFFKNTPLRGILSSLLGAKKCVKTRSFVYNTLHKWTPTKTKTIA